MQDSFDAERAQTRAQHERDLEKVKADAEREVKSAKKEYNERLVQNRTDAQGEVRKLKEDLYDSKGRKLSTDSRDFQKEKQSLDQYREEAQQEADRKVARAETAAQSKVYESGQSEDARVQAALDAQKRSSLAEVTALRDEMSHYADSGREVESANY